MMISESILGNMVYDIALNIHEGKGTVLSNLDLDWDACKALVIIIKQFNIPIFKDNIVFKINLFKYIYYKIHYPKLMKNLKFTILRQSDRSSYEIINEVEQGYFNKFGECYFLSDIYNKYYREDIQC